MKDKEKIKKIVRNRYAEVAKSGESCCDTKQKNVTCCGPKDMSEDKKNSAEKISKKVGYSDEEIKAVPEGANLGLGCGNPVVLASLKEGETVLDLGSGAGIDCFLAANQVGVKGKVIGVDMTFEMIERARENAKAGDYKNVEFRLGEIENIPSADNSVDVIISNCVINLAPDKHKVFSEAFRVLKPGGRLMVSDIVLLRELPDFIKNSIEAYVGCIAGAMLKDEYIKAIESAGFRDIKIVGESVFPFEILADDPIADKILKELNLTIDSAKEIASSVVSMQISGTKPND